MHKFLALALTAAALPMAAQAEQTTAAAAPAASGYSTATTDLGTLLDDPAAKAVLDKYIAAMIGNPQIDMARSMTLKSLQGFAGDTLTDDVLAKIDADLKALPPKK